jgi:prevent-host-death family protein
MKGRMVSIAEVKKGFSRLIDEAAKRKEEVIVTKRGQPVAVIVPYDEYLRSRKRNAQQRIVRARDAFLRAGIGGEQAAREAREELESRDDSGRH